jgi:hypothetical protein
MTYHISTRCSDSTSGCLRGAFVPARPDESSLLLGDSHQLQGAGSKLAALAVEVAGQHETPLTRSVGPRNETVGAQSSGLGRPSAAYRHPQHMPM